MKVEKECHSAKYRKTDTEDYIGNPMSSNREHSESNVRLLRIRKAVTGSCGFHLTRSKWDPYPWVSGIDNASPAERCGLKAGDCVLEVNGEDILGLNLNDIAHLVQENSNEVILLLWNNGCLFKECHPESLCQAPMPVSLQRLSTIVNAILSLLECPICLDTIRPPIMNCQNGHLICVDCRIKADKCPVCRDRFSPHPSLLAEQLHTTIINSFYSLRNDNKLQQKIFGQEHHLAKSGITTMRMCKRNQRTTVGEKINQNDLKFTEKEKSPNESIEVNKSSRIMSDKVVKGNSNDGSIQSKCSNKTLPRNKFLQKLLPRKTYSIESLSTNQDHRGNNENEFMAMADTTLIASVHSNHLKNLDQIGGNGISMGPTRQSNGEINLKDERMKLKGPLVKRKTMSKIYSFSTNDLLRLKADKKQYFAKEFPSLKTSWEINNDSRNQHSSMQTLYQPTLTCSCNIKSPLQNDLQNNYHLYHLKREQQQQMDESRVSNLLFWGKRRPCRTAVNCFECIHHNQNAYGIITTHSSLSSGINASMDSESSSMPLSNLNSVSIPTMATAELSTSSSSSESSASVSSAESSTVTSMPSSEKPEKRRHFSTPPLKQKEIKSSKSTLSSPTAATSSDAPSMIETKEKRKLYIKSPASPSSPPSSSSPSSSSNSTKDSELLAFAIPIASEISSAFVELSEAPVVASTSPIKTLESLLPSPESTAVSTDSASPSILSKSNCYPTANPSLLQPSSPSPPAIPPSASHLNQLWNHNHNSVSEDRSGTVEPASAAAAAIPLKITKEEANSQQLIGKKDKENLFSCPCECQERFHDTSELVSHIKSFHKLPILNFGISKAELALPLRQPLNDSILVLELAQDNKESSQSTADKYYEKITLLKECWINLKMTGKRKIVFTLVLQSDVEDSCILSIAAKARHDDKCR